MRHSRMLIAMVALSQAACGPVPEVTSSSPETGPYGTIITLKGEHLQLQGGRVEFDDGMTVQNQHMLRVSESKLEFRVPTTARGTFRLIGDDEAVTAGHFEPDPWRPLPFAAEGAETARLDSAIFGPDSAAELRREGEELVALFYDHEDFATVTVPDVEQPSAGVVWSEDPQRLFAFVLERSSDPVLRALEIDRAGARQVALALPEDATELLGFDHENGRRFAFVADVDEEEILKYEWVEGGLEETWIIHDPVSPTSSKKKFAARNGHAWRVWVEGHDTVLDVFFRVRAAYLAPGETQFQPALDLGGGDDSSSRFELLGVTDRGELALEFCARDSDIIHQTNTRCTSVVSGPEGTIKSNTGPQAPRTLHLAFADGLYDLVCEDEVHKLYAPGEPLGPEFGDPLLSPCVDHAPPYRLSPAGKPGFLVDGARGRVALTRL